MKRQSTIRARLEALEDRRVLAAVVDAMPVEMVSSEVVEIAVLEGDRGGSQSNQLNDLGDFDGNGEVNAADIDLLCGAMVGGSTGEVEFDITGDGAVDKADMDMLVHDVLQTHYGDADLDGGIDTDDAKMMFTNMFQSNTGWETGNFNCDGVTDGFDFIVWLQSRNSTSRVVVPPAATPTAAASVGDESNDTTATATTSMEDTATSTDEVQTEVVAERQTETRGNRIASVSDRATDQVNETDDASEFTARPLSSRLR